MSPDELIYAQPVDIKPIGKPIASIPVRGPPRAYGPPKPMPSYLSRPQKGPPKRVGYGGNFRPGFSDKYGVAGSSFQFQQSSSGLYNGHEANYVTKPPSYANDSPYSFENNKPSYNKPSSQSGTKTDSVVQQHVHHHYVHSDGDKDPKVIIKPVAIPVGSVGHLASQSAQSFGHQSSDIITAGGGDFSGLTSGGFKPMTGDFGGLNKPVYEADTIYGSQYSHSGFNREGSNVLNQGLPNQYQNNVFEDQQKYGNSLGAYGSQNSEFYKKELNVGSASNLYNQGASFGANGVYQENYHVPKAQGLDCVCVNYDQCPSQEIIGRRDDLYLPIDPRNKGSEITALTDEQIDNITKLDAAERSQQNTTETETKKVSKRETKENDDDKAEESSKQIEPVSLLLLVILPYISSLTLILNYSFMLLPKKIII